MGAGGQLGVRVNLGQRIVLLLATLVVVGAVTLMLLPVALGGGEWGPGTPLPPWAGGGIKCGPALLAFGHSPACKDAAMDRLALAAPIAGFAIVGGIAGVLILRTPAATS